MAVYRELSKDTTGLECVLNNCFLDSNEDEPNVRCVRELCDAVVASKSATTTVGKGGVITGGTHLIVHDWSA